MNFKLRCTIVLFFALLASLPAVGAPVPEEQPTFAERLGWPEGARVVIFHNDDAGMCYEANRGSIIGLEQGLITSWSIMMPCAWVPGIAAYLRENPEVCAGLHLTLTSEWDHYRWRPVACADSVPGLVDPSGYLWDNNSLVTQHASADEVETEIRAQIALARRMGLPITHLDTHMGTIFARPDYIDRFIKVGIETGIPVMIPGGHMTDLKKDNPEVVDRLELIRGLAENVWAAGLPVLDDIHTASYGWKTTDKTELFAQALRDMKPGVTQIIIHATETSPVFHRISTSGDSRQGDLNAMIDPKLRQVVEEENIILTNWRELKQRRDGLE